MDLSLDNMRVLKNLCQAYFDGLTSDLKNSNRFGLSGVRPLDINLISAS